MLILAEYSIFIAYFVMLVMGLCLIVGGEVDLCMGRVMRVGLEGLRMLGLGERYLLLGCLNANLFRGIGDGFVLARLA